MFWGVGVERGMELGRWGGCWLPYILNLCRHHRLTKPICLFVSGPKLNIHSSHGCQIWGLSWPFIMLRGCYKGYDLNRQGSKRKTRCLSISCAGKFPVILARPGSVSNMCVYMSYIMWFYAFVSVCLSVHVSDCLL